MAQLKRNQNESFDTIHHSNDVIDNSSGCRFRTTVHTNAGVDNESKQNHSNEKCPRGQLRPSQTESFQTINHSNGVIENESKQ
jgi:hypothetical protein